MFGSSNAVNSISTSSPSTCRRGAVAGQREQAAERVGGHARGPPLDDVAVPVVAGRLDEASRRTACRVQPCCRSPGGYARTRPEQRDYAVIAPAVQITRSRRYISRAAPSPARLREKIQFAGVALLQCPAITLPMSRIEVAPACCDRRLYCGDRISSSDICFGMKARITAISERSFPGKLGPAARFKGGRRIPRCRIIFGEHGDQLVVGGRGGRPGRAREYLDPMRAALIMRRRRRRAGSRLFMAVFSASLTASRTSLSFARVDPSAAVP